MAPPALSAEQAQALLDDGFVVVDDFLEPSVAAAIRAEAVALAAGNGMPEHRFKFGQAVLRKPNIYEADMTDDAMREALPELSRLHREDALAESLAAHLPELGLERGEAASAVKLQRNLGGGGCFPWHYDNAGKPSRRTVTCVVYLNPDWKPGDGGELVLCPFLEREVVIPPLMGRAALFRSDRILHRVLPASAERFCFTIWLDGARTNGDGECGLTAKHLSQEEESVRRLARSPLQRALSRAVYAESYEESLVQCLEGAPGCKEMLEEHRKHVAQQMSHPQLGPFVEHLRSLRPPPSDA
eukprot:TRINITY_DN17060_c0_g1_i1.p2 TRINITY_DN17060_c0_g1~~TRINITY_DN17060_c0_g1_i1.p2  ORF type:complete len:300 (+),score=85.10 TRINITY_DN17060_c0_g1_i1:80-979(+)